MYSKLKLNNSRMNKHGINSGWKCKPFMYLKLKAVFRMFLPHGYNPFDFCELRLCT